MNDDTVKTADGYSAALRYDEVRTAWGHGVSVEVAEGVNVVVGIEERCGRTIVTVKPTVPTDDGESGYRDLT